jgi:hypothetical protein
MRVEILFLSTLFFPLNPSYQNPLAQEERIFSICFLFSTHQPHVSYLMAPWIVFSPGEDSEKWAAILDMLVVKGIEKNLTCELVTLLMNPTLHSKS